MIYIPRCNIAYGLTIEDAEAICLLHSDLMVKQRRGWWTERITPNVWFVNQLERLWADKKIPPELSEMYSANAYQLGTDLGLLTKAEAWAIKEGLVEA